MSIRGKLKLMVTVVFLIIVTMTLVTHFRSTSIVSDLQERTGNEIVAGGAGVIREYLDKYASVTRMAAAEVRRTILKNPEVRREDLEATLASLAGSVESLGLVGLYLGTSSDGQIYSHDGWNPEGYDSRTRPWYQAALKAQGSAPIFTTPYVDATTGASILSVVQPISDRSGGLIGVVGVDIKMEALEQFVVSQKMFGHGSGAMILEDGLLVAHANHGFVLKANLLNPADFSDSVSAFARRMVAGETGFARYEFQGESRHAFFTPVGNGFFFYIFLPTKVMEARTHALTVLNVTMALIAIAFSTIFILFIIRGLSRAIRGMTSVTDVLSGGDLTARFEAAGRDELARIAGLLNSMLDSISGALSKVRDEAEESSKQASTLAALSQETLASMEEVSASVAQVNGLMEAASASAEATGVSVSEIAASAQSTAQASTDGAQQAAQVAGAARDAAEEVSKVLKSMASVGDAARQSLQGIRELGQSVDSISGFVTTITSIADQTNLLALNAAIEAARAGDAGRGFAVVAEEVRKLAEESGRAAQEVSKLIANLQKESESSTAMTESAGPLLQKAVEDAESAQKRLSAAQDAIESLNQGIQSIAAAAEKQATSSEEIAEAMKNLSDSNAKIMDSTAAIRDSSHETTTAAESIATAAQSMAETSERLNGLVDAFVLDGEKEHPAFLKG